MQLSEVFLVNRIPLLPKHDEIYFGVGALKDNTFTCTDKHKYSSPILYLYCPRILVLALSVEPSTSVGASASAQWHEICGFSNRSGTKFMWFFKAQLKTFDIPIPELDLACL